MKKTTGILLIGDVHGLISKVQRIYENHTGTSIQLGDFGFKKEHEWHLKNIDSEKHKICFGNHDDYTYLNKPHSLGNWSFNSTTSIFSIRGAYSTDQMYRVEGKSWWRNEEMNYTEMQECIDAYILHKPMIVVSHDCPHEVRKQLFNIDDKSITSNGMQRMFEKWKPSLWVFGHFHESKNQMIGNTRFICLNELETLCL